MKKLLIGGLGLLALWAGYSPPAVQAECRIVSGTPTYTEGQLKDLTCDVNGLLQTDVGGAGSSAVTATSTDAAPTYVEGSTTSPLSLDLSGNLRITPGTLNAGEDLDNDLQKIGWGDTRQTVMLGSVSGPTTATDATSAAQILPVGRKTFQGVVSCTGTCVQTQKIYGSWTSSFALGDSDLVCTLTMSGSTKVSDWCATDVSFSYWYVVTTLTGGTTPLSLLMVQY